MRIFNAISGEVFNEKGKPLGKEWPKDGYMQCPNQCDQHLFEFLEKSVWSPNQGPDIICASARWWERKEDELHRGPEFKKGTFAFRGSGIYFWSCSVSRFGEREPHFICEIPWAGIFDKIDEEQFSFVGEERIKKAIRAKADEREQELRAEAKLLQEKVDDINHVVQCCVSATQFIE